MASELAIQQMNIEAAFVPVDMQTGANNGDWASMKDYRRCLVVLFKAAGTAGDDPVFKLQQATDNAGTGAKDLNFTVVYEKVGTLASVAQFTRTTQSAATSYTNAASAEGQAIMVVEVKDADLDVSNDFTHIQLSVADVGSNAQLGCGLYIMCDPRTAQQIPVDAKA
jgi:hypothetical protein